MAREGLSGEREAHVAGAVDELEEGRGRLVVCAWLDAQDPCVAAGAGEVAFAEGGGEFGEEKMGFLVVVLVWCSR